MTCANNSIFYNPDSGIDRSIDRDIRKQQKIRVTQRKTEEEVMLWED